MKVRFRNIADTKIFLVNLNIKYVKLIQVFLVLSGLQMTSSCSDTPPPSNTKLLTQNLWTLETFTSTNASIQTAVNALTQYDWQFKADNTLQVTTTGSTGTGTTVEKWAFSSGEKKLLISSGSSSRELDIVTLDATKLSLNEALSTLTNTYEFVKK